MNKSRINGDQHVRQVFRSLNLILENDKITERFPETTSHTARFIFDRFPGIKSVSCKFDHANPDSQKDLCLTLQDGSIQPINLFLIQGNGQVQSKNIGARSFLAKYFLDAELQRKFNKLLEEDYLEFLQDLVELQEGTHFISNKKELKRKIKTYFPTFTDDIEVFRQKFLFSLREHCFSLLADNYNSSKHKNFSNAFKTLLMTDDVNIITRYKRSGQITVDEMRLDHMPLNDLKFYKQGAYSIRIQYGLGALILRFKFENKPDSSIKLHASYESNDDIQHINEAQYQENCETLMTIERIIQNHSHTKPKNKSNAIGKCNEAMIYAKFLEHNPYITQVDNENCIHQLQTYVSQVESHTLQQLITSSASSVESILRILTNRHIEYSIDSIQLVPESYISDRRDTADLKLTLRVHENYVEETFSLKAIEKLNGPITTKNPGIGSILGPTYFNIGSLANEVERVKAAFERGELNHRDCLRTLAEKLGEHLSSAPQTNLRQGINHLLGNAIKVITVYGAGKAWCEEHGSIDSEVEVHTLKPTAISNTLKWNQGQESISLRIKFSERQSYGWSSIKLTAEYKVK